MATFVPIVEHLQARGDDVMLTARDHAQTRELAEEAFGAVEIVGAESPPGRIAKAISVAARAGGLHRVARRDRPDVALSHGSYAQIVAARVARVASVTMMDYEHQPANHLSFRLADRVVVPEVFPAQALRRFGVRERSVVRYPGFKEDLYLGRGDPGDAALEELGLDPGRIIAVFRPPPEGALYHRMGNERFDRVLSVASERPDLQLVVLPRGRAQEARFRADPRLIVPNRAVDGRSLLAHADVMIGAGGTMNREAALLGTPTYTLFAGELAAVDARLIELGLVFDLRQEGTEPVFAKKPPRDLPAPAARSEAIVSCVLSALDDAVAARKPPRT